MVAQPLTDEQLAAMRTIPGLTPPTAKQLEVAKKLFLGRDPRIAKAYASDPRTITADSLLKTGQDTSPLAGGYTEGIARALSGGLGGYVAGQQRDKYATGDEVAGFARDAAIAPNVAAAAGQPPAGGLASAQPPAPVGPAPVDVTQQQAPQLGQVNPNVVAPPSQTAGLSQIPMPGFNPQAAVATALTGATPGQAQPNPTVAPEVGQTKADPSALTPPVPRVLQPGDSARAEVINAPKLAKPLPPDIAPAISRTQAVADGVPRTQRVAPATTGDFAKSPYSTVLGYGKYGTPPKPLETMTMGEVYDFGRNTLIPNSKKDGVGRDSRGLLGSSAGGAYQIVGQTMRGVASQLFGKDWRNRTFGPAEQDLMGGKLFEGSKGSNAGMRNQWASLKSMPDNELAALRAMPWDQAKQVIQRKEGTAGGMARAAAPAADPGAATAAPAQPLPLEAVGERAPVAERAQRTEFGDRVRSTRLQIVNNLLNGGAGAGLSNAMRAGIVDDFLQEGLTEDQASKVQREKDIRAQDQTVLEGDIQRYNTSAGNNEEAINAERAAALGGNRQLARDQVQQQYTVTNQDDQQQAQTDRDNAAFEEARRATLKEYERNYTLQERRLNAAKATEAEKRDARTDAYAATGAGQKDSVRFQEGAKAASDMLGYLDQYEHAAKGMQQGGAMGSGYVGGLVGAVGGNPNYGEAVAASNGMARTLGEQLKGSMSDGDLKFLQDSVPNPTKGAAYNEGAMKGYRRAAERQQDYWRHFAEAIASKGAQGKWDFDAKWAQYIGQISVNDKVTKNYVTFDEWNNRAVRR